jgi:hypothetical protein
MRTSIGTNFQGFQSIAENGALMGPWNPCLHEPKFGNPIWDLSLSLSMSFSARLADSALMSVGPMMRRRSR